MKFCMNCMSQYGDDYQICPHCGFQEGTLPTDSRCMEPGVILADRYIVGMPLAADSWTIRYIGWDALTEQKVTVNEFFPTRFAVREMGKTALTVVKQEPFYHHMSALLRRSRLLAETRLPETVCPVYESFEKNGTAYVITAHVEGQPMRDFLAERAPVSEAEAERLMLPVMRALDKLHENGFIARGFSPDHFTVVNGQPVLCDFIANCFFHVTDNPADIREEQYDSFYPPERLTPSETIRLAPENDVYSAAMIFYALLGIELPDGKARTENYQRRHKDILKKPSACGVKMDKSKENALINAAAPAVPIRTSDMETFIRELTSDREVPIKANAGKGFPLWAKIAIPAAAVVLIAAAILLIPMLFSKGVKDLPLDDKTVVPNVVSLTAEKAEQELQKAGLLLEIEGKTIDDSVDENLVLAQSVQQGEMVGVTVSAHSSEFSMPNFVGMQLAGCTDIMQQLGISYSTSAEYSESVAEGCVISQSVTPFTKVKAGQPLELTVSKGADPAKAEESAEEKSSVSEPAPDAEPSIPVPPAPYRPQPSATPYRPQPSATPSIFGTSSSEPKESEEPKPSTGSLFSSIIQEPEIPAPAEPEEPAEPVEDDSQDDEYIPADTSHEKHAEPTIFSFMPKEDENTESKFSFGFDEPEEQEEPAPMQPLGIFGNLSPSFLNDLENGEEEETVEPEAPAAPVQPRSQIAVQADKSGLIVDGRSSSVRAPSFTGEDADIAVRWTNVTSRLKGTNENIAVILERTSLKKEGTSAYIVFEDRDITLLSNLKKSQAFRQISSGIKDEFGADHLYICTQKQYSEQVKREQASELDRKLDDFNERSKNMGVPTDVHFGD